LPLQDRVRKQEAIRCYQIDLWPRRPAREQSLQHARGGGLADRNRAGHADDVRHLAIADAEELALRLKKPGGRINVDRQQSRQREINVFDFFEVEAIVERAQALELAGLQSHWRVVAQLRPLLPREYPVGVVLLVGGSNIHDAALSVALARGL